MRVVDKSFAPMTLEEFADNHGLTLEIHERPRELGARYYAYFTDVEVMERGCLVGVYGNGDTKEQAISDYADELLGKRIAIRAGRDDRRNVQCPNEWSKS